MQKIKPLNGLQCNGVYRSCADNVSTVLVILLIIVTDIYVFLGAARSASKTGK